MGKANTPAKHGKQNGKKMNKSKTDCVVIDWDEVEQIVKRPEVPKNAVTKEILMNKYNCSRTKAAGLLDKLVAAGWKKHKFHNGVCMIVYAVKADK